MKSERTEQEQPQPPRRIVELRGATGKCYGEYDPQLDVLIFRRGGKEERISLQFYRRAG